MSKLTYRAEKQREPVIDEKNRTVELSFSSDAEIDMGYRQQKLVHSEKAIDLSRLNDRAPLLVGHNPDDQVGVIERAWTDGKVGRALVRFGKGVRASEIFQDVKDNIRSLVSVGYNVVKSRIQDRGNDQPELEVVDSWTPMEISIVAVPADQSIGVGRDIQVEKKDTSKPKEKKMEETETPKTENRSGDSVNIEILKDAYESKLEAALQKQAREYDKKINELEARSKISAPVTDSRAQDYVKAGFSIARALRGRLKTNTWDGVEKEISDEIRSKGGNYEDDNSLIVPFGRNVTTATGGSPYGGYIQDVSVQQPVDALREETFFDRIGATYLTGLTTSVKLPTIATPATVVKNTEGGTLSGNTDTVFGQESLDPHIVQGKVPVSKALLATGVVGADDAINRDLYAQLANKMEYYAIMGSGSSGEPQGLKTLSGATTSVASGTNGTAYTYLNVVKMTQDSSAANARLMQSKFLTSNAGFGKLRRTEISSNTAKFAAELEGGMPYIAGHDTILSNNVTQADTKGSGTDLTHIYFGDWRYAVIGMFGGGIELLADPYTSADNNLVNLHATAHYDIGWTQPAAFSRLLDFITT